jgi:hypothetical protein
MLLEGPAASSTEAAAAAGVQAGLEVPGTKAEEAQEAKSPSPSPTWTARSGRVRSSPSWSAARES